MIRYITLALFKFILLFPLFSMEIEWKADKSIQKDLHNFTRNKTCNFKDLNEQILAWHDNDFSEVVCNAVEINKTTDHEKAITDIDQHVSVARIILMYADNTYKIVPIRCMFLSGASKIIKNSLSSYFRFIDTYGFKSSSEQSYSHSERAALLCISNELNKTLIDQNINLNDSNCNLKDICIQIRNKKRMCINCEQFMTGKGIYFIKLDKNGAFVGPDYKTDYVKTNNTNKSKIEFILEHIKVLFDIDFQNRLKQLEKKKLLQLKNKQKEHNKIQKKTIKKITLTKEQKESLEEELEETLKNEIKELVPDDKLDEFWEQIRPRTIIELLPYNGATILESTNEETLSEFVKIDLK